MLLHHRSPRPPIQHFQLNRYQQRYPHLQLKLKRLQPHFQSQLLFRTIIDQSLKRLHAQR